MASGSKHSEPLTIYDDIGILFISPIIGLPPSLISAFDALKMYGVEVEGVDIFEGQNIKKSLWKVLGLTALPGSHKRRVKFANNYNERRLFEIISSKIDNLKVRGRKKIIIGGMSGGFIFASRMAQVPPDHDIAPYATKAQPFIKGLFGISPLIFYPSEVHQESAHLELIPRHIPTTLIWGDADTIIPKGTIAHGQSIAEKKSHIRYRVIRGSEVNRKEGSVKHQFFGGRDFCKPLTNAYWDATAEQIALEEIHNLIKMVN